MSQGSSPAGATLAPPREPDLLGRLLEAASVPIRAAVRLWARVRAWRRIRFTLGGLVFTLGAMAVGFAALNTGNNLLYLLQGAMLGIIAVSGWMSEQVVGGLRIERHAPRAVTVGRDLRVTYTLRNRRTRLPSMAVEVREKGLAHPAFAAQVPAGGSATARAHNRFVRRGVYPLGTVTLSTTFPFGLFHKERDVQIPGEIIVWPRADRPVPTPTPGGGRLPRIGAISRGAAGTRGEYRNLREYRVGDDSRDIHWRSTARLRAPVVREYERDGAETRWIVLDTRAHPGDAAEVAVEAAASLAAASLAEHRPFALCAGADVIEPGEGPVHLEVVLDTLARVDFSPTEPAPAPPVDPLACVLVCVEVRRGWGSVVAVGHNARYQEPEGAA